MTACPKVLHISSLPLDRGGIEHVILYVVQALSKKYDFNLLAKASNRYQRRFRDACQGTTYWWGMNSTLDWSKILELNQYLQKTKPDLVHIHDARAGLLARPLLMYKKIPSLMTVHLPPYYYQWKRFSKYRQLLYGWTEGILNRLTRTHTVFVAKHTYEYALKNGYSHPMRSHLVINGIDLETFAKVDQNNENKEVIICCVARLSPEKNLQLLIRATAILEQQGYDFSLWLIGDGPELPELKSLVSIYGLVSRINFCGTQLNVSEWFQRADIFVLPSLYETHPLAVMEAQSAGLPCVLSNVGDHAEMVSNPECGFVFEANDIYECVNSLKILITSPELRMRFGKNARKKALKEHDKNRMIKGYDDIYKALLQIDK